MKKDVANYVSQCSVCQQVKAEHQKPTGLLLPLLIPKWEWDNIAMDFVMGLLSPFSTYQEDLSIE